MTAARRERLARVVRLCLLLWSTLSWALEDPGCTPLVRAAPRTASVAHPSGLLWRLTPAQGAPSYLLGTMHIGDPRVMRVMDIARPQFDQASRFVLEVALDDAALRGLGEAMFYRDGRRLRAVAGEALFDATEARLAAHGIAGPLADSIKPWAAFTTLSMPAESGAALPLDLALMAAAQAAGKDVVGLESVAEQVAVFEGVAETDQVEMLREVVCHYGVFQAELAEMIDAYVARDLAALVSQAERYANDAKDALMERLLFARNERMAARIAPLVDQGQAFIAIGALHLPGERGVLSLLEARGYRVERVY
ncbi:MAG: TraB/GumN family protein [Gammaproteobacteria bacterium]|jgi:uncharacterized protein|nr:TraB/GumN family protein [Gammaproteobacteria bacterium]